MPSSRVVLIAFVVALGPLVAAAHVTPLAATPSGQAPAVKVIELKAEKYKFTPATVEIPAGTAVQFKITALDHEHGFEIEGVKDSCVSIPKGETKTVDYKADKAGKITFKCCHVCGLGHGGMKGSITVK